MSVGDKEIVGGGGEQRQKEHNKLRYHQSREGARWMKEEGMIRGSQRGRKKETFKLNNSYMCECGFSLSAASVKTSLKMT